MSAIRQKRKSCEACRARKLKCSGKDTGCSRCVHLGLVCRFHDKGMPGRPRKWSLVEPIEPLPQHRRPSHPHHHQDATHPPTHPPTHPHQQQRQTVLPTPLSDGYHQEPPTPMFFENSSSAGSADLLGETTWTPRDGDMVFSSDEFGAPLPFLDFNTSNQLDSLPLDPFRACLAREVPAQEVSPGASTTTHAEPAVQSCDCAKQVFESIRSLNCDGISHATIHALRRGTDLFEKLLTCPICYDVSKPPRVTLQNVLLIGRLTLEVTTRYQKYLKWLKDQTSSTTSSSSLPLQTVYLLPSVGFSIPPDKFYDLVAGGLKTDAERLSELGRQFEARQRNRHLIGHGACPDSEGRCWKEKDDEVDPDPSDVCPQSPAARALIPCYRVVDEVRAKIKLLEDALV